MDRIILASKSPRRRELMNMLDVEFEVINPQAEEKFDKNKSIEENVLKISYDKAKSVFNKNSDAIVIGVDTVVSIEDYPLGKPKSKEEAAAMLRVISGTTHEVVSGINIMSAGMSFSRAVTTKVTFKNLTREEIDNYVQSGEGLDKAGAYGIQGKAGLFVRNIEGDYYNVVGLSINTLYEALNQYFL